MLVDFLEPEAVQERPWADFQPSWFPEASGIEFRGKFSSQNEAVFDDVRQVRGVLVSLRLEVPFSIVFL